MFVVVSVALIAIMIFIFERIRSTVSVERHMSVCVSVMCTFLMLFFMTGSAVVDLTSVTDFVSAISFALSIACMVYIFVITRIGDASHARGITFDLKTRH